MAYGRTRSDRRRNKRRLAYRAHLSKEGDLRIGASKFKPLNAHEACKKKRRISKWVMNICGDVESLELATTARERLRGMLFRDPDDITRLLIPCRDIHTFGMRYPLDVAFISKEGNVLEVHRHVSAMRRLKHKEASLVAERFSKDGEWLEEGDVIHLGCPRRTEEVPCMQS